MEKVLEFMIEQIYLGDADPGNQDGADAKPIGKVSYK